MEQNPHLRELTFECLNIEQALVDCIKELVLKHAIPIIGNPLIL